MPHTHALPTFHRKTLALISKSGPSGGGASVVAAQLHLLLSSRSDIRVDHWTTEPADLEGRRSLRSGPWKDGLFRLGRFVSRRSGFTDFLNATWMHHTGTDSNEAYDLYHVHDISSGLSPLALKSLTKRSPVVWTLHDCSPFTGGCVYPLGCETYSTGCGQCPQLSSWPLMTSVDRTAFMRRYKLDAINQGLAAVVCPSMWMAGEAIQSGIRKELIHVIPNAVDTKIFHPRDISTVRSQLGLPLEGFVVFLGSASLINPYKGTRHALEAIARLGRPVHLLLVGEHAPNLSLPDSVTIHVRNFTSERSLLADYYAACDVFVLPSLAENFPLMLLESMACGTPAIAFATGGIVEALEHEYSGWLTSTGHTEGLTRGLAAAMDNPSETKRWGINARHTVEAKFNEDLFVKAHLALYAQILASSAALKASCT